MGPGAEAGAGQELVAPAPVGHVPPPFLKPDPQAEGGLLITNVRVFDGLSEQLSGPMNVLIEGSVIAKVSAEAIAVDDKHDKIVTIDGDGKIMTPGLIDMHQHLMLGGEGGLTTGRDAYDFAVVGALGAVAMRDELLMRGTTSVRDIAGNSLGIQKAVKNGVLIGPRVYSVGPAISQTGGHGDWGYWSDEIGDKDKTERDMNSVVADGVPEVIRAARHNFRRGAAGIKVMQGGGMASEFDPIEATQYSLEELEAIVGVANDYGSYVSVHGYHDRSTNRALDAGVKVFEHQFLISEETVKRMKREGSIWSFQCHMSVNVLGDYNKMPAIFNEESKRKALKAAAGVRQVAGWMKKHGVMVINGSDMFGEYWGQAKKNITCETQVGFSPAEALIHATGNAGKVLAMSGHQTPYKGKVGVIEEGAYADLLLWSADPLQDINVILDEEKLQLIMKDGLVFKNTL